MCIRTLRSSSLLVSSLTAVCLSGNTRSAVSLLPESSVDALRIPTETSGATVTSLWQDFYEFFLLLGDLFIILSYSNQHRVFY